MDSSRLALLVGARGSETFQGNVSDKKQRIFGM